MTKLRLILALSVLLLLSQVTKVAAIDAVPQQLQFTMNAGWTFISFPWKPVTATTAEGLINYVADKGGSMTMVSRWDGDRWQEYGAVGEARFGNNFDLQANEAYFVRNVLEVTIDMVGRLEEESSKITLRPGWNAIGLSPSTFVRASAVLDSANQGTVERANEIDRWLSGNWQPLVKRIYNPTNIQEYGDNFPIEFGMGYMIKANTSVELTP